MIWSASGVAQKRLYTYSDSQQEKVVNDDILA